jgi:hypothetical protein
MANPIKQKFIMNAIWLTDTALTCNNLCMREPPLEWQYKNCHFDFFWKFFDMLLQQKCLEISVWQSYTITSLNLCIIWNNAHPNYINIAQFPQ